MNLKILLGHAAPYRLSLLAAGVLMLLETAAALAVPWFGGEFAAGLLSESEFGVTTILLGLLALFAFQALLRFANQYVLARTSENILADLRIRTYDHLQALPLDFHHARQRGDLLA